MSGVPTEAEDRRLFTRMQNFHFPLIDPGLLPETGTDVNWRDPRGVFDPLGLLDKTGTGMDVPGYELLANVLRRAYDQAARGKGKERHGNGRPFHDQPMQDLIRSNGLGFATGQIGKKASEALGLGNDQAIAELLGCIVYAAGAIIAIERDGVKGLKP